MKETKRDDQATYYVCTNPEHVNIAGGPKGEWVPLRISPAAINAADNPANTVLDAAVNQGNIVATHAAAPLETDEEYDNSPYLEGYVPPDDSELYGDIGETDSNLN
jgi:hypothetical protein